MNFALKMVLTLSVFAFAGASVASDVLLTQSDSKKAGVVALDVVSDGNASAFNFVIPLGIDGSRKVNPKQIDLTKCLAELPKTHVGGCAYRAKKNDIAIFVYSPSNDLLPKGIVGLGTITAPASLSKSFVVKNVEFASPSGGAVTESIN